MGCVFLAYDPRLHRKVAVKVLATEAHPDTLRRFEQEARAAGLLNHPNILSVFDVGAHRGAPFIVSELLEGSTLRDRLSRGALSAAEALDLALQLARGLAAAHDKGVVHRDLKPENLFLLASDGRLKILDFGIAKLLPTQEPSRALDSRAATTPARTETGTVMGTVGYMSPEQVRGEHADQRSDIFSFGAILYELLAGRRAFEGEAQVEVGYAILNQEPPPLDNEELDALVRRCLAKSPKARFQTAHELAAELQALQGTDLALGRSPRPRRRSLFGGLASLARGAGRWIARPPESKSIAVLPFANLSGDPQTDYFSDGMTEELINALAGVSGLRVASRTSSFAFKGKLGDVRRIGEKLAVGAVVEGSVRKSGSRVRISARLVNAGDGYQIWSQTFERDMIDIFELQDEISRTVADGLKVKLGDSGAPLVAPSTKDVEAYHLYLKGRYHFNQRPAGIRKGIEFFEQAIAKDPAYAFAHAGLADCYANLGSWENGTLRPREAFPKAKAAAQKALEIDPRMAEPHSSLAYVKLHFERDLEGAEREIKLAIQLKPDYPTAHHWYSHVLTAMGRSEESLVESQRCLELDPLDTLLWAHLAWHYIHAQQFSEAIAWTEKLLEEHPDLFWAHFFAGEAYACNPGGPRPWRCWRSSRRNRSSGTFPPTISPSSMPGWASSTAPLSSSRRRWRKAPAGCPTCASSPGFCPSTMIRDSRPCSSGRDLRAEPRPRTCSRRSRA
jgi:TolB-like protein/Tfp pilus assembly protein PilF